MLLSCLRYPSSNVQIQASESSFFIRESCHPYTTRRSSKQTQRTLLFCSPKPINSNLINSYTASSSDSPVLLSRFVRLGGLILAVCGPATASISRTILTLYVLARRSLFFSFAKVLHISGSSGFLLTGIRFPIPEDWGNQSSGCFERCTDPFLFPLKKLPSSSLRPQKLC